MLRALRARSSQFAYALVLSLVATMLSPSLPGHDGEAHDSGCLVVPGSHQGAGTRVGAARADAGHTPHCLACHLARAFRPLGPAVDHDLVTQTRQPIVRLILPPAPIVLLPSQLTLRSPPATSAL